MLLQPLPPPPEPTAPMPHLLHVLAAMHKAHQINTMQRLAWALYTSAAGLTLTAFAWVFLHQPFWGARMLYLAAFGVCAAFMVSLAARLWRRAPRPQAVSHRALGAAAQQAFLGAPHLGSSVPSAWALWQADPHAPPGSLAAAHQAATLRALQATDPIATQKRKDALRLRPWRRACARLALLAVVLAVVAPRQRAQLAAILQHQQPVVPSLTPLVGDLTLTLTPPSYSHLPVTTVAPSDGSIAALTGSTVRVQGRQDGQFHQGMIHLADGTAVPVTLGDHGAVWADLPITAHGHYTFVLTDAQGVGHQDALAHPINAWVDAPPEALLRTPQEDVVLKDGDAFTLRWEASDDLALSKVFLVVASDGNAPPRTVPLPAAHSAFAHPNAQGPMGPGVSQSGNLTVSARLLGLKSGAGVRIHVAAQDNAPDPGPQVGISASRLVTLFSARAHHEKLLVQQAQILDALVDWLAQEIGMALGPPADAPHNLPSPWAPLCAQLQSAHHALREGVAALRDDALAQDAERLTLTHILQHTQQAEKTLLTQRAASQAVPWAQTASAWRKPKNTASLRRHTLEQDILYLDQLLAHGRLEELRASAQDLLAAKAELQDLLARYKQTHDAATRAQIAERMAALKSQIQTMMAKMANLRPALPQAFYNAEAEQHDRMAEAMARINDALQNDNIDAMAQDLEHLANMVDNVVSELAESQTEREAVQSAPMQKEVEALQAQIKELAENQAALTQKTDALAHQQLTHSAGGDDQALTQRLAEVQALVHQAQQAAGEAKSDGPVYHHDQERLREKLAFAEALIGQHALRDAAETLAAAEQLAGYLSQQQRAWQRAQPRLTHDGQAEHNATTVQNNVHSAKAILDRLLAAQAAPLPEHMGQAARHLAKAQRALAQKTQEAAQAMEALAQQGPQLGQAGTQALNDAQQAMQQSAHALADHTLGAAKQSQQQAHDLLQALQQSMQNAGPGPSGGMPMPMGASRTQKQGPGQTSQGGKDDVQIPKDEKNALPAFRKRLLEAAKERPPLHYEEEVRRYYDDLMR